MGLEAKCEVSFRGAKSTVRAHLDSNKLDVYLKPALHVPFAQMKTVVAKAGALHIGLPDGPLVLQLGDAAERWAQKILQPKSRLSKLGVKESGVKVAVLGELDEDFVAELTELGAVLQQKPSALTALIFLRVSSAKDLSRLAALARTLAPKAALWVIREKGKDASVREAEVRTAARAAGLVDVKVVSFSDRLTADKFVKPGAK